MVVVYGGLSSPVGILVIVALWLALYVFVGLFRWGAARLLAAFGPAGFLGAPILWSGLEMVRTHTFFSFPWVLLGYTQHALLPFAQLASIAAVYGVSFLVGWVSAATGLHGLRTAPARARRGARRGRPS